ncbi:MAG: acyl-CoA dehydrogenase family protein [Pseudomonadales bacterium]|jgi:alkylation response protein AidB-like acyl-CoA dehydrogenase|nr:acyl-CoA dehydrogenase family protein [Pseudomonadales bacterium]MDA0762404.1 acyl-CoA dehydrogenase family protein [Pseudomonadota bacterium]MDA0957484.1 acyl-CoA dehydrogenase family protein [Pseudomonadota bacterium]MDA1208221.1 acyl-CoA dehydrogenase family protein [Pseudomonadota bacterium]
MSEQVRDLESFRAEVASWLQDNFPKTLKGQGIAPFGGVEGEVEIDPDAALWRDRLASRGWGTPTWPSEIGGGGLSHVEAKVLSEEMHRVGAINPIPLLAGMGVTMVGPTILEYGTEDQKRRHIPGICSGKIRWCLGYSEPNAGSDLASLATKAEDNGDFWLINGQKVWTSGADISQWCGALVRTDPSAKKRDGISFLMLKMDQPGVETRPIKLIAGASPFCETFFNDARAEKGDLLGALNDGWSVGKRLLQHERASQTGARPTSNKVGLTLQDLAKQYVGEDEEGKLLDSDLRTRIASHLMHTKAHGLTVARIAAEAKGNPEVSAAASILKNSATRVSQERAELALEAMGHQGIGWEGDGFTEDEIEHVRGWLSGKAISIYGGSFEIQNNIIAKNILGLPEMTQKG